MDERDELDIEMKTIFSQNLIRVQEAESIISLP
jgi:hypothetical protein